MTAAESGVVTLTGGSPLTGEVRVPGDKSISHRALLLAALAEGTSTITGLSDGDDVRRTRLAVEALGADVVDGAGSVTVHGGRSRLHAPAGAVDLGNSGTGMRLLLGLLAGLPLSATLTGDASLSRRPMDRVAVPLGAMGATVTGRDPGCRPPVTVAGGHLRGITYTPPMASAQVKSAVLLAGLDADGATVVEEPVPTRAHTEEMLARMGADIEIAGAGAGRRIRLRRSRLVPVDWTVPGDPSQAAFWVVAGCLVPGSDVEVRNVYAGAERLGFMGVLERMGGRVAVAPSGPDEAHLTAAHGALRATVVAASEIPSLDEVPVLAVAAAAAVGTTVFEDVGELRVKESDRLAATVALVEAFGGRAHADGDRLVVEGTGPGGLTHGHLDSHGDHRMAMAAVVAALAAGPGRSTVAGFGSVATSYPGFLDDLGALAGPAAAGPVVGGPVVAIDGPAGAGKSTVAAAVAERLGVERLDTGAMYRAVAWAALERGVDPADEPAVAALAAELALTLESRVLVDGTDVTAAIRSPEVGRAVSVVAALPAVRRQLVARQRAWVAERGGAVVEGRDIGTVVFPEAPLKVYLTASEEERARRRHDEPPGGVARRDRIDSSRAASPLVQAPDARLLDTTGRSVEDVVEEVLSWL